MKVSKELNERLQRAAGLKYKAVSEALELEVEEEVFLDEQAEDTIDSEGYRFYDQTAVTNEPNPPL